MDPIVSSLLGLGGYGVMGLVIIRLALEYRTALKDNAANVERLKDQYIAKVEAMKDDYRKMSLEAFDRSEAVARAIDKNTEAVDRRRTQSDDKVRAQRGGG
jgi:hypothetical protein